jgi:hypothetical protein
MREGWLGVRKWEDCSRDWEGDGRLAIRACGFGERNRCGSCGGGLRVGGGAELRPGILRSCRWNA